jgi:hypothetical protein
LFKLGFNKEEVAKFLGGNFMRVFKEVWKPRDAKQGAARVATEHATKR